MKVGAAAQAPVAFVSVGLLGIQNTAGEIEVAYGRRSYTTSRQQNVNDEFDKGFGPACSRGE